MKLKLFFCGALLAAIFNSGSAFAITPDDCAKKGGNWAWSADPTNPSCPACGSCVAGMMAPGKPVNLQAFNLTPSGTGQSQSVLAAKQTQLKLYNQQLLDLENQKRVLQEKIGKLQ